MTEPFGAYLHLPYCPYKCHYCDFNAYRLPRAEGARQEMAAAIAEEILRSPGEDLGRTITSIFFGGGTPSVFRPEEIGEILQALRRRYGVARGAEVTLECNPGTVDEGYLRALRRLGVTRLSIGAQSFRAETLARIGRLHTPAQTRQAVRAARAAGFKNVSLDVIYGLPGETPEDARASALEAISLGVEHLSAYALELEEETLFGRLARQGRLPLPPEEEVVRAGDLVAAACEAAGLQRYEISNFARSGRRARHNMLYWHQGSYRGFGPGAHSHLWGRRFWNAAPPGEYLRRVGAAGEAVAGEEVLSARAQMGEWVYLRLRLQEGFTLQSFARRFGLPLDAAYPGVRDSLRATGLLDAVPGRVRPTPDGRWLLHRIAAPFLA